MVPQQEVIDDVTAAQRDDLTDDGSTEGELTDEGSVEGNATIGGGPTDAEEEIADCMLENETSVFAFEDKPDCLEYIK